VSAGTQRFAPVRKVRNDGGRGGRKGKESKRKDAPTIIALIACVTRQRSYRVHETRVSASNLAADDGR